MLLVRPALLALFTLVAAEPDALFRIDKLLYSDSFTRGTSQWIAELEKPGMVEAKNGILRLDVPAGATFWFRPELHGPVMIQLVANRGRIQYYRYGNRIFDLQDPAPYTSGRFGLRTTFSHIEVRNFRVYRLQ